MNGPVQLAVGVGGHAFVQASATSDEIKRLQDELRQFPLKIVRRYGLRAVKKAGYWGKSALESQVGRLGRKTGNLARAVALKTKVYTRNKMNVPVPIAVIGYRRSGTGDTKKSGGTIQIGNDRAFHSHLVEFGTKRRYPGKSKKIRSSRVSVNGRRQTLVLRQKERADPNQWHVMSSYKTSGPFKVNRGGGTSPAYPFAFIAKVDASVGLGAMPAFHPVQKAFDASKNTMQNVLLAQFQIGLQKAAQDFADGKY